MKKIGLICAADTELAPFLQQLEAVKLSERALLRFYEGRLGGVPVVALYSGVCKVNAAIATQVLIDDYGVDAVLNAGTAGGMAEGIGLFDTVISTEAVYHDVAEDVLTEFHPWMPSSLFPGDRALLQLAREMVGDWPQVFFGRMATGEQFITERRREAINRTYGPLSVDMETAAIAHVCYANGVPFLAVRSITDTADHQGMAAFEHNCQRAAERAKEVVLALLRAMATA